MWGPDRGCRSALNWALIQLHRDLGQDNHPGPSPKLQLTWSCPHQVHLPYSPPIQQIKYSEYFLEIFNLLSIKIKKCFYWMISRKCSWQRWKVFCFLVDIAKVNRAGQADSEWCHQLCGAVSIQLLSLFTWPYQALSAGQWTRAVQQLWGRILWVSQTGACTSVPAHAEGPQWALQRLQLLPVGMGLALTAQAAVLSKKIQLGRG